MATKLSAFQLYLKAHPNKIRDLTIAYTPEQAAEFKRIFDKDLRDYWNSILGFNVVQFEARMVPAVINGLALPTIISRRYGQEATALIRALLQIGYEQ